MKNKILQFVKKYWHYPALLVIAGVFFVNASWFNYATQSHSPSGDFVKWASPDETANYQFAKLYGQTDELSIFERYNLYANDIIHPRSFRSDHGEMKPVSFLGMILLYGSIVKWFGYRMLPFLTPFFATAGLIFYYLFVRRLFGRSNALLSVIALSFFPVYVYYSARSMFHNVLFTVFLVISLYFLTLSARKVKRQVRFLSAEVADNFRWQSLSYALSGAALGAALFTRTSEIIWLAPLYTVILLALLFARRIKISELIFWLAGGAIVISPMFYYNQLLYGSPFFAGYGDMNNALAALKDSAVSLPAAIGSNGWDRAKDFLYQVKDYLFHFGIRPRESLLAAKYYILDMFPWLFWPAVVGGLAMLVNIRRKRLKLGLYLLSLGLIGTILIIYYGSWVFYDNPDKSAHTIGNSYTRYWLPVYLGLIPMAVYLLIRVSNLFCLMMHSREDEEGQLRMVFEPPKISRGVCRYGLRALAVGMVCYTWFVFVYWGSDEGLVNLAQRQWQSRAEWSALQNLTEQNSVIITQYHDKLVFPERKVVVGLFDDKNMITEYANLAGQLPTYYYNFTFPDETFEYLNERRLRDAGLGLSVVAPVTEDFTLYKLNLVGPATSTAATTTNPK